MSWEEKIKLLKTGFSEVRYNGKKYGVTLQNFNKGKSLKAYANESGGPNFISFNYYLTSQGAQLKPCEMPKEKVIDFLEKFVPILDEFK